MAPRLSKHKVSAALSSPGDLIPIDPPRGLIEIDSLPPAYDEAAEDLWEEDLSFARKSIASLSEKASKLVDASLARLDSESRARDFEVSAVALKAAADVVEKLIKMRSEKPAPAAQAQIANAPGGIVNINSAELLRFLKEKE
jgi:hypothetical protein